jgi:hypothetical protein
MLYVPDAQRQLVRLIPGAPSSKSIRHTASTAFLIDAEAFYPALLAFK